MNLKKLKCPSCGADIHLKYGSNKTTCEYCGSEYIVSEDEKDKVINIFNNMANKNFTAIKIFKTVFIFWIIIFITFTMVGIFTSFNYVNKNRFDSYEEIMNNGTELIEKSKYNQKYTKYSGINESKSVVNLLNECINDKKEFTILYDDKEYTTKDSIKKLSKTIKNSKNKYFIVLDFYTDGYINKINIKIIK